MAALELAWLVGMGTKEKKAGKGQCHGNVWSWGHVETATAQSSAWGKIENEPEYSGYDCEEAHVEEVDAASSAAAHLNDRGAQPEVAVTSILSTFPRDSFTPAFSNLCTVKETGGKFQAIVELPAYVTVRGKYTSHVHADSVDAKHEAFQAALESLEAFHGPSSLPDQYQLIVDRGDAYMDGTRVCSPAADLRNVTESWPTTMSLMRLKVQSTTGSSQRFGVLMSQNGDFGLRLCLENMDILFAPAQVAWPPPDAPDKPEELICRYHEIAFYTMLPHLRPKLLSGSGDHCDWLPSVALLVRVADAEGVSIAWQEMQNTVNVDVRQCVHAALGAALDACEEGDDDNDEVEMPVAPASSTACVPHIFYEEDLASCTHTENRDGNNGLPPWLLPVLHRIFRFLDLNMMARVPLAGPASWHPCLLDLATTLPGARLHSGCSEVFASLQHLGCAVLRAIVSLAIYIRNPSASSSQLEGFRNTVCGVCEVSQMAKRINISSILLSEPPVLNDWRPPGVLSTATAGADAPEAVAHAPASAADLTDEDCAHAFEALVAAHFLQQPDGLASAASFCVRAGLTIGTVEADADHGNASVELAEVLFGHYAGGCEQHYFGRTPTVEGFQQVTNTTKCGQHVVTLHVHYNWDTAEGDAKTGKACVQYRRSDGKKAPLERNGDDPDAGWMPLAYSYKLGTFVSCVIFAATGEPRPLPNKVYQWLSGRPPVDLARVVKSKAKRPRLRHIRLQEKRGDVLCVTYDKEGVVCYRRSHTGNLGMEEPSHGTEAPLFYSELDKALISLHFDMCLPHIVVEWLQGMCLASLVGFSRPLDGFHDVSAVQELDDRLGGNALVYRFEYALGGCILLEQHRGLTLDEEELIYSVELENWLSPHLLATRQSATIVADGVIAFIRAALHHTKEVGANRLRDRYAQSPWRPIHAAIRPGIPSSLNVAVIEAKVLEYTFNEPLRLLEAMSHPSSSHAVTGDYQRLAVCGSGLVELLVLRMLLRSSRLPVSEFTADRLSPDWEARAAFASMHAALGTPYEMQDWPRVADADCDQTENNGLGAFESFEDLSRTAAALCNHDMYARACVRLGLHTHVIYDSVGLGPAIARYVHVAHRAEIQATAARSEEQISRHDAPRVLSDVFLACAAAVFLDSDWRQFRKIFEPLIQKHLFRQGDDAQAEKPVDPVRCAQHLARQAALQFEVKKKTAENTTVDELLAFIRRAEESQFFCINSLAAAPPDAENTTLQRDQVERAFALRDFHMYEPMLGNAKGESLALADPVVAASPRSAQRRCASFITETIVKLASDELGKPGDKGADFKITVLQAMRDEEILNPQQDEQEEEEERQEDEFQGDAEDAPPRQAVYCECCGMELNGPKQFQEHKIGKKHKKNMRRHARHAQNQEPGPPALPGSQPAEEHLALPVSHPAEEDPLSVIEPSRQSPSVMPCGFQADAWAFHQQSQYVDWMSWACCEQSAWCEQSAYDQPQGWSCGL